MHVPPPKRLASRTRADRAPQADSTIGGFPHDAAERGGIWESCLDECTRAARDFRRSSKLTLLALIILGIGIAATTTAFSIIDVVFLRPFNYVHQDRLYVVREVLPRLATPLDGVNALHFREWKKSARSFEEMALLSGSEMNISGIVEPQRVFAARTSSNVFDMLGIEAFLGRTFQEGEEAAGRDLVVVLGYSLWRSRFASDRNIVGRTVTLDGQPHTIVGVLPPTFEAPNLKYLYSGPSTAAAPELWKPFGLWGEPALVQMFGFACIARIRSGMSQSQAASELNALQQGIGQRSGRLEGLQARIVPLQEQVVGRSRVNLLLLLAGAFAVLVVGCVNFAQLLYARNQERRREFAIKRALGASEARIAWQLLLEAVIVGLVAGAAALVCALYAVYVIQTTAVVEVARLDQAGISARVLLFALVTSVLAGIASALVPAIRSARIDPNRDLKGSLGGMTPTSGTQRSLLIAAEVAISTTVLIIAAMLVHSFMNILAVDRGFTAGDSTAIALNLTDPQYSGAAQRIQWVDSLISRVRMLPMVSAVGVGNRVPMGGAAGGGIFSAEGTTLPRLERPVVATIVGDPGYFAAVGIPVLSGRAFHESDRGGRFVAVISAAVAQQAWPGQDAADAVGRRFRMGSDAAPLVEVIGVAGSTRSVSLLEPPSPDVYFPYWQDDMSLYSDRLSLIVRSSSPGAVDAVRRVLREIDPRMPWPEIRSLDDIVDLSLAPRRFQRNVILLLALVAMLMTCVGIYSVISHRVTARRKELGIRLALGAQKRAIQRLVFRDSVTFVIAGIVVGVVAAVQLMRLLGSVLFGIDREGIAVTVILCSAIVLAAAVAAHMPVRRLARLDPVVALRAD